MPNYRSSPQLTSSAIQIVTGEKIEKGLNGPGPFFGMSEVALLLLHLIFLLCNGHLSRCQEKSLLLVRKQLKKYFKMANAVGIEPTTQSFGDSVATEEHERPW